MNGPEEREFIALARMLAGVAADRDAALKQLDEVERAATEEDWRDEKIAELERGLEVAKVEYGKLADKERVRRTAAEERADNEMRARRLAERQLRDERLRAGGYPATVDDLRAQNDKLRTLMAEQVDAWRKTLRQIRDSPMTGQAQELAGLALAQLAEDGTVTP